MSTCSNESDLPLAVAEDVLENIIEMVGLNEPDFLVELIETYLDDSSKSVQKLPEALSTGDLEFVQITVHSLKSTSATFSAHRLSTMAGTLEAAMRNGDSSVDLAAGIDNLMGEYERVRIALVAKKRTLLDAMA